MSIPASSFLHAVLGPPAAALERLGAASPAVGAVLVPRAVTAWLAAGLESATVPGTDIPYSLAKSDAGWTGRVGDLELLNASDARAAAAVLVHLDVEAVPPPGKDVDLARLGKTVTALVRVRHLRKAAPLEKAVDLTLEERSVPCGTCGSAQVRGGEATLCHCLQDLAKHVRVEVGAETWRLRLGAAWTSHDIAILEEAVGRGRR